MPNRFRVKATGSVEVPGLLILALLTLLVAFAAVAVETAEVAFTPVERFQPFDG